MKGGLVKIIYILRRLDVICASTEFNAWQHIKYYTNFVETNNT
jgi:hypothetical protein